MASVWAELKRRNVVRVAIAYVVVAWLVVQVAETIFPLFGFDDTPARFVVVLLAIGFIPVLIFSWAFDLTAEGIKRTSAVEPGVSTTAHTGSRLNRLIIIGLLLVIGMLIGERTMFTDRDDVETNAIDRSVAVLPFADLSEGGDQAWFTDGLTEEILNALARTPDLLVAARTSSFAYKGSEKTVPEIAGELGVAHILEGSVRRSGDRLRVTAQLIRADDGFHLWSQNYDRMAADVIDIQEDLAVSIARALETTMDPEALERMLRAGTRSVEAYESYLEGLTMRAQAMQARDVVRNEAAHAAFERARSIDPGFAAAHYESASLWFFTLFLINTPFLANPPPLAERMALFQERIQMAIDAAPNPVDKDKYAGRVAETELRIRDAVRIYENALQHRPNDRDALASLTAMAVFLGDRSLLDAYLEKVYENWDKDAGSWAGIYLNRPWRIDGTVADREQYIERVMRIVQRFPTRSTAYAAHRALLWMGETEKAAALLPQARDLLGTADVRQACAEGRRADAEAELQREFPDLSASERAGRDWYILMLLGRPDEAAAALKPYESLSSPATVGSFLMYPQFDPRPFPILMDILRRENVDRVTPVPIPFACPPENAS